jgi:hypothetical protein
MIMNKCSSCRGVSVQDAVERERESNAEPTKSANIHGLRVTHMDEGRYAWCREFQSESPEGKTDGDTEP